MRVNDKVNYAENKLAIKPEGWVDTIVFDESHHSCGNAFHGIGINILGRAGGVLSNDDAIELLEFLKNHFRILSGDMVKKV